MDCSNCQMPHMEFRMDEQTGKSKLWDTNLNRWHDCKESPDYKFKIERQKILKAERLRKIAKYKTPIFCSECNKGVKPILPCEHMLRDGFKTGIDDGTFYSDHNMRLRKQKQIIKPEEMNLDKFQSKLSFK